MGEIDDLLSRQLDRHYISHYRGNPSSLLNSLCDLHGSDKGEVRAEGHPYPWPSHTYADLIERLYGHCRSHVVSVFECGLGTNNPNLPSSMGVNGKPGASLRVWRDYFPNAQIYGADVDKEILFQEERIRTFHVDQTSASSIHALWAAVGDVVFDLMIDDGLHTFEAGVTLLMGSFHKLRSSGLYIIEDVSPTSMLEFRRYLDQNGMNYELINLYRPQRQKKNNSLVVIRK